MRTDKDNAVSPGMKILVMAAFILMVVVNFLANTLPLNGRTTGAVSDSYPNLFAPAGITFSIWGVIYVLLGAYAVYQLLPAPKDGQPRPPSFVRVVARYFIISSLANTAWIFAWHHNAIFLSFVLISVILFCLVRIKLAMQGSVLSTREKLFLSLPFSVYFGWITVATIANVTALLVSIGWLGQVSSQVIWTVAALILGTAAGSLALMKFKDRTYGLVLVWAYAGIILKHVSRSGFGGSYPVVIAVAGISILIFIGLGILVWPMQRRKPPGTVEGA